MTLIRNTQNRKTRATLGLGLAALVLGMLDASSASAQTPPYTAYGTTGLDEGQTVEVLVDGESCGADTVNAAGEWGPIYAGTDECPATEGDELTFMVDGVSAVPGESIVYVPGGAPADTATGIVLTLADDDAAPAPEPAEPETPAEPAPAPTGSAGLLDGDTSTVRSLVLPLTVLAVALITSAYVALRRR